MVLNSNVQQNLSTSTQQFLHLKIHYLPTLIFRYKQIYLLGDLKEKFQLRGCVLTIQRQFKKLILPVF